MPRLATLLLVAATSCGTSPPTGVEPGEGLNVLFIGNSLTSFNDLPGMVASLLDSAGVDGARVGSAAFPDWGLEDHWNSGPARDAIAQGGWDVVILQQGPSATEGRPSLLEYTRRFAEEVEAEGGQIALYMVWPSRARSFDFDGVSDSYRTAALENNGILFPAGDAWRLAWEEDAGLELYGPDGFHPSPLGSYLAALVMVSGLTGESAVGLPARVEAGSAGSSELRFPPDVARLLQQAADRANRQD